DLDGGLSRKRNETSFLFGWLWKDPNSDLAPEALLQRLHPKLREEIVKRPRLKKSFEDDVRAVFKAYKNQASLEEFRELVDGNISELNHRIEAEGPRHMRALMKHAKEYSQYHGIAHPLLFAPRAACCSWVLPLPFREHSAGCSAAAPLRYRNRDGSHFL
ncbi:unnamed protein product, partial [Symbiodinium necroappetens]